MVVHWCGTGLSAIPGLKKLIMDGNNVIVWNRTVSKATKALAGLSATIHQFNMNALEEKLAPGDIIVSPSKNLIPSFGKLFWTILT